MSARFTLEQISKMSPSIQAQVMAEQERAAASQGRVMAGAVSSLTPIEKAPPQPSKPAKNRIRQNSAGLNRTEQAFLDYLNSQDNYKMPLSQAITLKIGNGVRYTPDFVVPFVFGEAHFHAFEVKGYAREDAIVKLKVAAYLYPWITFHLVTRKKGKWQIQEVLP